MRSQNYLIFISLSKEWFLEYLIKKLYWKYESLQYPMHLYKRSLILISNLRLFILTSGIEYINVLSFKGEFLSVTNIRNDSSYLRDDLRRSLAHRRAYRIRRNDEQEEASGVSRRYSTANGSLIRVEGPSKSRSDDRTSFLLARGTASKKRLHRLSSTVSERASDRDIANVWNDF